MGKGYFEAHLFIGDELAPASGFKVLIKDKNGQVLHELVSGENGRTGREALAAPDVTPENSTTPPSAFYDVEVPPSSGFKQILYNNVEIFDGITTILPIQMQPAVPGLSQQQNINVFHIPTKHGVQDNTPRAVNTDLNNPVIVETMERILANEVAIPYNITVHLGSPNNDAAQNYTLPFIDYIKNVAAREIFPTWTKSAITANILAQMSFALSRFYTLHYRSVGKNFDITNTTAFDQAFDPSKQTFDVMSNIVNEVFGTFIRRQGRREPFFASYCNGTTSTCAGLSQYGSQNLGLAGYTPEQILKHYYPSDIQIVESTNFAAYAEGKYPGTPLKEGGFGEDVLRMQIYLNRLSGNWYITPIPVQSLNGFYGGETKNAVTMFQNNTPFNLSPDGIIGSTTWYAITRSYVSAKELSELISEGERIGIGDTPPTVTLYPNTNPVTRGAYVVELQFLINYIAKFYSTMTPVIQNGVFGEDTKRGVIYFQQEFGLTADGVVGPATWRTLYAVFNELQVNTGGPTPPPPPPPPVPPFPGTALKVGSTGSNVLLMQNNLDAIAQVYTSIPRLVPDGIFGSITEAAVKAFQKEFGLTVDGIIGQNTWYKIIDVYNGLTKGSGPQFPGTNLTIGARGNDVLLMQKYLNAIAKIFPVVPSLVADGIFGNNTAVSVRAFQSFFGLTADGVIGKNTWDKIVYVYNTMPDIASPPYPGTALRVGSRGNDVLIMQKYLNAIATQYAAIPTIVADGVFGPATEQAVLAFQRQFGLTADGIVGINTWNKLISVNHLLRMYSGSAALNETSADYLSQSQIQGQGQLNPAAALLAMYLFRRF